MASITTITPTFYRCADTTTRKTYCVNLIPSSWKVAFSDGSLRQYCITLSSDILDPKYDSNKDSKKTEGFPKNSILNPRLPTDYYIQIDPHPKFVEKKFNNTLTDESFDKTMQDPKDLLLCPKHDKGHPMYFYVISPKNFEKIPKEDFQNILDNQEKIDNISQNTLKDKKEFFSQKASDEKVEAERPYTTNRIKKLDLNEFESKTLFQDLFEKYLMEFIQKNDSSITVERPNIIIERPKKTTESTPLIREKTCLCCTLV